MTIQFGYDKNQVMQALRYHFLTKPEIRIMIIVVNVFAFISAALYYFKRATPLAFLTGSFLWFAIMISFWYILPGVVYQRSSTFKDQLTMSFEENDFTVGTGRGSRSWTWTALSNYMESPNFFHLYFDSQSFFIVPKNGFDDYNEIVHMRRLLKQKVKKKRL